MMYFQKKFVPKKQKHIICAKYICTLVKFVKFYYYVFAACYTTINFN